LLKKLMVCFVCFDACNATGISEIQSNVLKDIVRNKSTMSCSELYTIKYDTIQGQVYETTCVLSGNLSRIYSHDSCGQLISIQENRHKKFKKKRKRHASHAN
jgi:hypothetical protein